MAYSYYRSITVAGSALSNSTHTNFPLLVLFTHDDLRTVGNGGHVESASGSDIGFFVDAGLTSALDWELVAYDGTTGKVTAFVRIPSLDGSVDTTIYAGYGDSGIVSAPNTPASVWESSYRAVWTHAGTLADSTANGQHMVVGGSDLGYRTGKICQGRDVGNGGANYVATDDTVALSVTGALTLATWVYFDSVAATNTQGILSKFRAQIAFSEQRSYVIGLTTAAKIIGIVNSSGLSGGNVLATGATTVSAGSWIHVAMVYVPSTSVRVYVNGAQDALQTASVPAAIYDGTAPFSGGMQFDTAVLSAFMDGSLEFSTVEGTARSADWIADQYATQNDPDGVLTLGPEQATGGAARRIFLIT